MDEVSGQRRGGITTVEQQRGVGRRSAMRLVLCTALLSGCGAGRPSRQPIEACDNSRPIHIVVGVAAHGTTEAKRRDALRTITRHMSRLIQPGAPAVVISVYPLTNASLHAQPARLRTACIPALPDPPDIGSASAFEKDRLLATHRKGVARVQSQRQSALRTIQSLGREIETRPATPVPVEVWGFLQLAGREFATVDSDTRHVVIIAPDEEETGDFCDACRYPLNGATVTFLNFDQPTTRDQEQRQREWALWTKHFGAGEVRFFRSNDPVPALFAGSQT